MGWFTTITGYLAPIFLVMSPVLSYSDQAISMHRNKSSAGFSLDIPLIMLVASLLKIFYWPGARFDNALLIQAVLMVGMQIILLKIALEHRLPPSSKGGEAATPFANVNDGPVFGASRPYHFWQWRSPKPYWQFLLYFFIVLIVCELLLAPVPVLYQPYSNLIGYVGLAVEATLPLPQIFANSRSQSCKGFRLSVLASWLAGDAMKMFWFFTSTTEIPWAFKLCGMFQACCDSFLGVQYLMYGDGEQGEIKEHPMSQYPQYPNGVYKPPLPDHVSGRVTPTRRTSSPYGKELQ
ncbi:PQ-loop repeat-containing protein 1 [Colletotrichum spinosum]|uniref:PQ-loop repeat-containing protein 1 n=1 Tax=Colletotrichum spinosum TaxID=1347390 RepID=A0A4R8PL38_9PEZI|nr:PQ-loop repeat-containing protein 1 [Colletotrichum spinosum]